jgi:hypothetical protein
VLAAAAAAVPAIAIRTMSSSSLERLVLTAGTYLMGYAAIAWCGGLLDSFPTSNDCSVSRGVCDPDTPLHDSPCANQELAR